MGWHVAARLEAEIVLKSGGAEVRVSGIATWGGGDPQRVKRGAVNTGELEGTFKPQGQVLAIGYDPGNRFSTGRECSAGNLCSEVGIVW